MGLGQIGAGTGAKRSMMVFLGSDGHSGSEYIGLLKLMQRGNKDVVKELYLTNTANFNILL